MPGINIEQEGKLNPSNAEQKLEKLQEKEFVLTQIMARLPINDELFANQLSELKVVAQERADVEKDFLEVRLKENPALVLGEEMENKRRVRIRVRLLNLGKIDESDGHWKARGNSARIPHLRWILCLR